MSAVLSTEARVYHAFRSPYSRLGLHVVKRAGLNPPVYAFTGPPEGVPFSDPVANPPKLLYYMQDAPRMTRRMGLPMTAPDPFEVEFTPANRALAAAALEGRSLDFAIAAADARWGTGRNISSLDVLEDAARTIGWSPAAVIAAQSDPAIDEQLTMHKRMIEKDGVFGVPFAIVGTEKFWGHDRFDLFVEAVQKPL